MVFGYIFSFNQRENELTEVLVTKLLRPKNKEKLKSWQPDYW